MQQNRDLSFDAFRGIAIIAVVAIHALDTVFPWRRCLTLGGWNLLFIVTYRQLLNFAVPAFIFISGYWMSKKPMKSLEDYKTFLIRRLSRILIPYLFWSFVFCGYAAVKAYEINAYEIMRRILAGQATWGYYFIIVIAQLYILTPLLQYINRKPYGLILVLIVNVISLLFRYLSKLYFNCWFPSDSLFYSWVIFYEIGLLVGGSDTKIFAVKKVRLFILPAILICLLISELEGMILLLKYDNLDFAVSAVKYSSFFYSVCIIFGFLFVRERTRHWPKSLVSIGTYSFGIYLMHVPVLTCVVRVLEETKIYSLPALYQIVVGLITISVCLALIVTIRTLLPKPFCRSVFGF